MKFPSSVLMIASVFFLTACGGGSSSSVSPVQSTAGSSGITSPQTPSTPPATPTSTADVTVSGKVTFDNVPPNPAGFGLDYTSTFQAPARGIVVNLVGEGNETLAQDITDENGAYSFTVAASLNVKVQASAHLLSPAGRDWDVKVSDNTSNNALYVLAGALQSSGTSAAQTRNLNAPSGWGGAGYSSNRAAAPFAVLDTVYKYIKAVDAIDPNASFPALDIFWSPNNRAAIGDTSIGNIGTSGFHRDENAIFLLGDADRDTDEYDPHVIVHEWGHYFEHNLSRLDSIAGLHSLSAKLDPRLAFSEGWGNALAAIVTGDPQYKDSSGLSQTNGLNIDFETIERSNEGWFSEASVSALIYDIFDTAKDEHDNISAGFAPIYKAMTDNDLRTGDAFVTIFSFSEALLQNGVDLTDYRTLLEGQSITASNALGMGELNNGSIENSLPVYKEVQVDGGAVQVCSVDDAGNFNRLGNREFVFFDVPAQGNYVVSMTVASGGVDRDPDFNIWSNGEIITEADRTGEETISETLAAGRYVAETYDFFNINGTSNKRGDGCFNFSIVTG